MSITNIQNYFAVNEVFLYPLKANGFFLLYAPLSGSVTVTTASELAKMEKEITSGKQLSLLDSLTEDAVPPEYFLKPQNLPEMGVLYIIPNFRCNFHCSYCYAATAKGTISDMPEEILRQGVEAFLDSTKCRRIRITFMGGGEPLLSWKSIHNILPALKEHRNELPELSVITNGSILTDEFIRDCKDCHIQCCISYEIIPEIQESQRGMQKTVEENIRYLTNAGIKVRLRATITPELVMRQKEMVEILKRDFPGVSSAIFEPVTSKNLIPDAVSAQKFYTNYYTCFCEAAQLAEQYQIELLNSFRRSCDDLRGTFCNSMATLMPDGRLLRCPCFAVPTEKEEISDSNCIGILKGREFMLKASLSEPFIFSSDSPCKTCLAKWHCAGGCEHNRREYPADIRSFICETMRKFLRDFLCRKLDRQLRETGNVSLEDFLKAGQL